MIIPTVPPEMLSPTPKKPVEDTRERYIFPVGETAPGPYFAPTPEAAPSPEGVVNPQIPAEPERLPAGEQGLISRTVTPQQAEAVAVPQPAPTAAPMPEVDQPTKTMMSGDAIQKDIEAKQAQMKGTEGKIAQVENEWKKTQEEVKNFQWDNRSLWDKSSTAQKIGLLIGGFLSSMSQSGAEAFRKSVTDTMDRDLAQQKLKFDALKEKGKGQETHLGQLTARLGSEEAGMIALRGQQIQMIQTKLQSVAQSAQSRIMAQNAQTAMGQLEIEKAKLGVELQKVMRTQAGDIKNINLGPYKGYVGDDATAREFTKKYSAVQSANQSIEALKTLTKQGAYASPEDRAKVQSLLGTLVQQSKDILGTGVLSDSEREALMESIGDPTRTFSLKSSTLAKLETFQRQLNQIVQNDAKALKLYKDIGVKK